MRQAWWNWWPVVGYGLAAVALTCCVPDLAHAGGGKFLWNKVMDFLIAELTGPVAVGVGTIAIIGFGLGLCMSDGGGVKTIIGIIFGLSVALTAVAVLTTFFGVTAGASW